MTIGNSTSRRQFLEALSATTLLSAGTLAQGRWARAAARGAPGELTEWTAIEALAALRKGDITAEAYAHALLARCAAGASLNAFITLRPDAVLEAARECDRRRSSGGPLGPLHGLPVPIKDSVNTRDLPTTAGTPALRHFQPAEDAPLVRKLREAGAIVLGKTNLHELSFGYTSNNHAFGTIHNPYDPSRIPGGSSGGTAAAVAYRMAPLGVAEDTEGSIRVPAALCGIAGFRPTTYRYPTTGCVPVSALFDQLGPHARSVADLALFDSVITGEPALPAPGALKGVRLGLIRSYYWSGLDAEVERVAESALRSLKAAGAELVEGDLPELPHLIALTTDPVQNHDVKPALSRFLAEYHTGVTFDELVARSSPDVRVMIERTLAPNGPDHVSDAQYREVVEVHLPALRKLFQGYFDKSRVSALVFPATILAAPKIGEENMDVVVRGKKMPLDIAMPRNIAPGSTTGLPGLVLPAGLTRDRLPVALQLDGPSGSDRKLLALGVAIESTLGRLPPPPGA